MSEPNPPRVTDEEILIGLLGGEAVAVTAYQWRTGVAWSDAESAVRAALDDAMSGRREPGEAIRRKAAAICARINQPTNQPKE